MINITNYIFLAETILLSIRDLKGSLVLNNGDEYYVMYHELKRCMEKGENIKTSAKVLSLLMFIIAEGQEHLDILNEDGYVVATIYWNKEKQIYEK